MHRFAMFSLAVLAALMTSSVLPGQIVEEFDVDDPPVERSAPKEAATPDLEKAEQMIVRRTNRFREKQGLEPVQTDPQLEEAAQYFADYMARTGKYGHTADGQRPSERAGQHGYAYCIVSENIAYRYSSVGFETKELARGFVKGWKTSPDHRKNMLDAHVTETGVAVAHSEETGAFYAVQMFGRPRAARIRFQVVNRAGEATEYTVSAVQADTSSSFELLPRVIRTHQRCRPSEIRFAFDESLSISVEDNTRYIVATDPSGELTVETDATPSADEEE